MLLGMFKDRLCDGADVTTLEVKGFYNLYSVNGSPLSPFWASNKVSKTVRKQPKTPLLGQKLFKVEENIQIGTMVAVPTSYNIAP